MGYGFESPTRREEQRNETDMSKLATKGLPWNLHFLTSVLFTDLAFLRVALTGIVVNGIVVNGIDVNGIDVTGIVVAGIVVTEIVVWDRCYEDLCSCCRYEDRSFRIGSVPHRNKQDYHGTRHHDHHLWEEPHHV